MSERSKTLAAFLRSQAGLTDKHPHKPGPGSVTLNHEEALLCADALEEAEDDERLRTMMRDILVATADVLKGDPGPLKLHSWHDLAEVAGRQRELLAKREAQLAEAIARMQENYRAD